MTLDTAPHVLLIDDDVVILDTLSLTLEADGFICHTALDGIEALRSLNQTPPDIIISDLRMPNMSGFELLPILRRCFPHVPIIVCSSEPLEELISSVLPMNAYIQKGTYRPEQFISIIREVALAAGAIAQPLR